MRREQASNRNTFRHRRALIAGNPGPDGHRTSSRRYGSTGFAAARARVRGRAGARQGPEGQAPLAEGAWAEARDRAGPQGAL